MGAYSVRLRCHTRLPQYVFEGTCYMVDVMRSESFRKRPPLPRLKVGALTLRGSAGYSKFYRACISKTSSPPDMMSAWWIFQSVIGLPFSVTDFTYLFPRDRFLAMTVNVLH